MLRGLRRFARKLPLAGTLFVCLAGVSSAQTDAVAKVSYLTGRVSLLRDAIPYALDTGDVIKPRQVIVTGPDGYAKFDLIDGSTFEVYPNSHITFRDNMGDWRDLVEVWLGKIKVHIQRIGGKPNVNRVNTPTAVISVKGTTFEVNVEDDGGTTFVMVEEGIVGIRHRLQPGKELALTGGDSVRIFRNQPLAQQKIDKGVIAERTARSLGDLLYDFWIRGRRGSGSSSGGGGTAPPTTIPGDEKAPEPPPAPPPPPPI